MLVFWCMKITNQNIQSNRNFTSRNPEIRQIDDLCRFVKQAFPVQSPSRLNRKPGYYNKQPVINLDAKLLKSRDVFDTATTPEDFYRYTIQETKASNVANCGELGRLSEVIFKLNGYKDCSCLSVNRYFPKVNKYHDLDHAVLGVRTNDNKLIIVDPWCGFVDYVENAATKYKHYYSEFLDFFSDPTRGKIVFKSDNDSFDLGLVEKFKCEFPELIFNKKAKVDLEKNSDVQSKDTKKLPQKLKECFSNFIRKFFNY